MAWTWRLEKPDGTELSAPALACPPHNNQSDAESWLGENWRELRSAGVASVSLLDGEREVYGGMSLSDPA